jgi:hypothetical protein
MRSGYGTLPLVALVKLRVVWRAWVHSVRTTVEGKAAAVMMLVIPFAMKNLMVSSALRQANLNEDAGWVVFWVAHLSMIVLILSVTATQTARALVVHRREDPLSQYPHTRQGLAAFHLWGEMVASMALPISSVFYLFYGSLVVRLAAHPLVGTLLHVIGHTVVTLALGSVAYRLTLRALERRPALGPPIFHLSTLVGVFAFFGIAGGPQMLLDFAPNRIGELRSVFDTVGWSFPPVAALVGSTANPGPVLTWAAGVGAAGVVAWAAAAPLIHTPSTLLLGEVAGPVTRRFRSLFTKCRSGSTHRIVHGARMFLLKDVLLFPARFPGTFIGRACAFLGTACLAPYLGWGLQQEGLVGAAEAEALVLGLVVFLVCAPAFLMGIGSFGSEGHALVLLRPFVRTSDLMSYKTVAVLALVVPAGLVCGAAVGGLSWVLNMTPGPLAAAFIGSLAAGAAATLAVSLSFLFPDFERRNLLVPGSSRLGRFTFVSVVLYGASLVTALRWMTRTGVLPTNLFVPGVLTVAGMGIA